MTIVKGSRVRVHADGEVVLVREQEPRFKVMTTRTGDTNWDRTTSWYNQRSATFFSDEVELVDKPLVKDNGWLDVCADTIREGKIEDALAQIAVNAPRSNGGRDDLIKAAVLDVVGYIGALQRLQAAFGPLLSSYPVFEDEVAALAYEDAVGAYMALAEFRKGEE